MGGLGLLIPIALLAGLFFWFRRSQEVEPTNVPSQGRISLLTEAVAYIGAVLMLAGVGVAIGQRWEDIAEGVRFALLAGLALFFLGVGYATSRSTEPAFVRLTSVVWLIGTIAVAGALAQLMAEIVGTSDETSFLVVASATTALAAVLYAVHRMVLQHVALYAGVLATALATLQRIDPEHPAWIGAIVAWAIGLAWMLLGAKELVTPSWVAVPVGILTALIAPTAIQESNVGAMFAVGIATAVGIMANSVVGRFVPGLALGAVGLFAYVTGAVVRYFGDEIGAPAALVLTGGVILSIAAVTARLARFTRTPPAPGDQGRPSTRPRTA